MMKQDNTNRRALLTAMVLLAVFALSVVLTLLSGAGAYRRLLQRSRQAYESRTASQYLAGKLRQAPAAVEVTAFGDGDALVIPQTVHGVAYETRVYCYGGWLMELFCLSGSGLSPEDGEKVLPVKALDVVASPGLMQIQWTDSQGLQQLIAELPAGKEVLP